MFPRVRAERGALPLQVLFWIAIAAALFACLDFYFQFPAPAGFEAQYVWLASGVYRRAQGLFYEASTLANFCAFFLVMIAVALVRRVANRAILLAAGAVFAAALIFSYSRAAVLGFGVDARAPSGACLDASRLPFRLRRSLEPLEDCRCPLPPEWPSSMKCFRPSRKPIWLESNQFFHYEFLFLG